MHEKDLLEVKGLEMKSHRSQGSERARSNQGDAKSDGQAHDNSGQKHSLLSLKTLGKNYFKSSAMSMKIRILKGKSLWLFSNQNRLRILLYQFIQHRYFDNAILCIIVVSSIQLILENPLYDPESLLLKTTDIIDKIITAIFLLEFMIKTIVYGFIACGSNSYMRTGWNVLDFCVVSISLISYFIAGSQNFNALKVLRLFRVMKPLRMISRNEGLKLCVKSLILSLPGIFNVLVLSLIFLFILSIFFTNLLKGRFYHCSITEDLLDDRGLYINRVVTKWDCLD